VTAGTGDGRTRALVGVEPESTLASHARLLDALARAFGVEFAACRADPGALSARIAFGAVEHTDPIDVPSLELVEAGCAQAPERTEITFSTSSCLPTALRGRSLADHGAASFEPLRARDGEEALAWTGGGPLWLADRSATHMRAAGVPAELGTEEILRDRFGPGAVFPLLPLVVFLNQVGDRHGVRRPPLRASIVIDDPNAHRPTYGFIDFRRLDALARAERFHVAFSTIPLDAWLADPRAAACFRGEQPALSFHVHGNNHLHGELGRDLPDERGLAEMAQALRRIERFERRSGLAIPKVMVPPHGRCSRATAARLARLGFEAICMSSSEAMHAGRPDLAGWLPAEIVEGLPVLPRHQLAADRDEFVFRALLGQPLIPYGHHGDGAGGLEVFEDIAHQISALGDVRWTSLAEIARTNVHLVERPGQTTVRLFSRDATVDLDGPSTIFVEPPDDTEISLHADGTVLRGPGPHEVEGPVRLRIVTERPDVVAPDSVPVPPWRPWPVARRVLTEARDRSQPLVARVRRRVSAAG
jgi:hypothetical protein